MSGSRKFVAVGVIGFNVIVLLLTIHPLAVAGSTNNQSDLGNEEPGRIRGNRGAFYTEIAILHASDAQTNDGFGKVAISNDTIVVGAPAEDGGPGDPLPDAGAVYVFERDQEEGGNWREVARLTASDADTLDRFGSSVAIDGDTIVIGASGEGGGPGNPHYVAGAAYVFERDPGDPGSWLETKKISAGDIQSGAYFGDAVAISNDTIVVGAIGADGSPVFPFILGGAAYVFERDAGGPGSWGESKKIVASDAEDADYFGFSVDIEGDTIVIGARFEDGGGIFKPNAGAAYVFDRNLGGPGHWGQSARLSANDAQMNDQFGNSVTIDGGFVVIGALGEDGGPGDPIWNAGAAYVFELGSAGPESWTDVTKLAASDAQAGDFFGISVVLSGLTLIVGAPGKDGGPGDPSENLGAVYTFENSNFGIGNWSEVLKLISGDHQALDGFGAFVAIEAGTLTIAASGEDGGSGDPTPNSGAVYVFKELVIAEQLFLPVISR